MGLDGIVHFLRIHYIPGTVVDSGDTLINISGTISFKYLLCGIQGVVWDCKIMLSRKNWILRKCFMFCLFSGFK